MGRLVHHLHHLHHLHHHPVAVGPSVPWTAGATTAPHPTPPWCSWCRWCIPARGRVPGGPWGTHHFTKGGAKVVHGGAEAGLQPVTCHDPNPDGVGVWHPQRPRPSRLSAHRDGLGYLAGYSEGPEMVIQSIPRQIVPEFRR
jgi:hypothetical protein